MIILKSVKYPYPITKVMLYLWGKSKICEIERHQEL